MNMTIARIGKDPTIVYAFDELMRLLRKMDKNAFIDGRVYDERITEREDILWIGLDGSVPASDIDEIRIDVKDGAGIITGANERSVLIAVYRFMYELGCRFLRPGRDSEDIPERCLDGILNVSVSEKASYRHRSVCIEGANSYEHVCNMIDWLPKVGLNGYFRQMHNPSDYFTRFYNADNPHMPLRHVTEDECMNIWGQVEHEIAKRKLDYHAVGHGWTCVPFGITKDNIPEDIKEKEYVALVNGERQLRSGSPLWTNLCYSKKEVRDIMNDAVVEYCKEHPDVNFMHFWLADGVNWHCECEECQKMTPSDFYVMILNELDEKLTAAGLDTKVVCLLYCDLLWEPEKLKIANPDRFVLMFAPIDRTYSTTFASFDENEKITLKPYERNKLVLPSSVAENVAMLKKWQDNQLPGDSFDFDYHLMWDHYVDPGYYDCARILHDDMVGLEKIGLHGMVSCQGQRVAFPTGLPMYGMAKALWNKNSKFVDVAAEYFTAAFGEDAKAVEEYMAKISNLFCPSFIRGEKPISHEQMIEQCKEVKQVVDNFCIDHIHKKEHKNLNWNHLAYHADYCKLYADVITAYTLNDEAMIKDAIDAFDGYLTRVEPIIGDFFDRFNMKFLYNHQFKNCSK